MHRLIVLALCGLCVVGTTHAEDDWLQRSHEKAFWNEVDDRLRAAEVERLAVLPFAAHGESEHARRVQRRVESALIQLSDYRYVVLTRDPADIERLLEHADTEASDLVDQSTTARLGQLLGVQMLVQGEVSQRPDGEVRLWLDCVQAQTGQLLCADTLCWDADADRLLPLDRRYPLDDSAEAAQFRFWRDVGEMLRRDGIERISVLPLGDGVNDPERQFEAALVQRLSPDCAIIAQDRTRLEQVLSNLDLELSDLFDPRTVARVGQFLGVTGLVLLRPSEPAIEVDILNAETGRIVFRGAGSEDSVGRILWERR